MYGLSERTQKCTKIARPMCQSLFIFIFFISPILHKRFSFFCLMKNQTKKRKTFVLVWKFRKAWHICDEILLLFSLFILSAYGVIFFLLPRSRDYMLLVVWPGDKQRKEAYNHAGGVVAARLDTMEARNR